MPGISAQTRAGPTSSGKYQSGSDSSTKKVKASLFSKVSMRSEAQLPAGSWHTMARPELLQVVVLSWQGAGCCAAGMHVVLAYHAEQLALQSASHAAWPTAASATNQTKLSCTDPDRHLHAAHLPHR